MKYKILSSLLIFFSFNLYAQHQQVEITINEQFESVVSESGLFENGKNYTLSFVIDQEINRTIRDSKLIFTEAVKDITFNYDNGKYLGTIAKADLVITDYSGGDSTNVLMIENMRGIDMPSIEGNPFIMKSPFYFELAVDTSGLASGELSDIDLSASYVVMKTISMGWGFQGRNRPPEWLYDEISSITTVVIPE